MSLCAHSSKHKSTKMLPLHFASPSTLHLDLLLCCLSPLATVHLLANTIVSIRTFVQQGKYKVKIKASMLILIKINRQTGLLDFKSNKWNVLYYFKRTRKDQSKVMYINIEPTATIPIQTLNGITKVHDKFGHIGKPALHATLKTIGMEATRVLCSFEWCALAKARTKAITKILMHKADKPGEWLCTDSGRPYKKSIIGNNVLGSSCRWV